MPRLSNTVRTYYFDSLDQLTPEKQFHLASRLYLFSQDPQAQKLLQDLRPYFTHNNQPSLAIQKVVKEARAKAAHGSKNAAELRQPYFEKYPELRIYLAALFRINFLKSAYGIDARQELFKQFDRKDLEQLRQALLQDASAIAILSTHAVNFFYLYDRLIKEDVESLQINLLFEIGQNNYGLSDRLHLQLLIYLYTHCIIGESRFYARHVPKPEHPAYQKMIVYLEKLISKHFSEVNLDNKFEFLVCAKILGYKSSLEQRIMNEAAKSISEDGHFLIDRHNNNPQHANTTLDSSEHRNVLFLMSQAEFKPLGR